MAFERSKMAGWLSVTSVVAGVFAVAMASCGDDSSKGCVVLPCPFPGFDVETCSCRHPDARAGDAGEE